jgi:hypothetical protein
MKRNRNRLPWYLLTAVVLIAVFLFFSRINDAHRLVIQNFDYSQYFYLVAAAAANGDTNGVMRVLTEVYSDSSNCPSRVLEACDKNREQIIEMYKQNQEVDHISKGSNTSL